LRFKQLELPGVWLIEPEPHEDERGSLRRHFCAREFADHGLQGAVTQGNIAENTHIHTLRGFHYQLAPHAEAKTMTCLSGTLYDVVVDLRPESPLFGRWIAVELSTAARASLHIPAGCANAYLTMAPNTTVHYYMSEFYAPESYRGFRFDDPAVAVKWPAEPRVVSARDLGYPGLDLDAFRGHRA